MRTKIATFVVILFLSMNLMGQDSIEKPYDCPVKPEMKEWAEFQTGQEMLDACQIPVEILGKLTTEALVKTCINYPLAYDYFLSNDERGGISFMIENFNGLKELSKRENGASELVKAYKNMFFSKDTIIKTYGSSSSSSLMFGYLELLLVDDSFISKLSRDELNELKNISLEKYDMKLSNPDDFGLLSIKRSFLVNSVIIMKNNVSLNNSEAVSIQDFIANYQTISPEKLESVSKLIVEK